MIDLHCHSSFSDGVLSPQELIQKAVKNQIQCLALTDHDTVEGSCSLREAAKNSTIKLINGIELSTQWKKYDIHILGYGMDHTPELMQLLARQNQSRIARAQQIGVLLELLGIHDGYAKACQLAGHERVGRPYFAQILVNEGKAKDMASAFKNFLVRGKKAYVPSSWVNLTEGVETLVRSGGTAVIAHPLKYGLTRLRLRELISVFKEAGGEGIEVVSGAMMPYQVEEIAQLSVKEHLLAATGSDYHSDKSSSPDLGYQRKMPEYCNPVWEKWNIE